MSYKSTTIQKIKNIQLDAYRNVAKYLDDDNEDKFYHNASEEMLNISNADGITFYIKDKEVLQFIVSKLRSLKYSRGGLNKKPDFPPVKLFDERGNPNLHSIVTTSCHKKKAIVIKDIYEIEKFDFSGAINFDNDSGYRTKSVLIMPIKDYKGQVQGVVQMINAMDLETDEPIEFNNKIIEDLENFTTQVGSYMTQRQLIKDMENLFEALIKLIAKAIDKKSHYTGKHCERVPILAEMISNELCKHKHGFYENLNFTKEEKNELRIAAWLHDTGKIATPPHINDKATKLERIIDGIELIEHRVEILKRDAKIEFLKDKIKCIENDDLESLASFEEVFKKKLILLDEYLKLLSDVNIGGENLAKDKLNQISKAHNETIVINNKILNLLDDYEKNALSIKKGTLNDDERNKINEHVSITYELLKEIPFPKNLSNVPIIASYHHEKLDGTGYPFGKKGTDLSVQSRILAFSDIFEALTAPDRPYKRANTLSESLEIMYEMCSKGKIDKEIFKVFVSKKLYKKYANEHINQNQIDKINTSKYLSLS